MSNPDFPFDDQKREALSYRKLIASCPGIIFLLDLKGQLLFLGGALEKLIGFRADDFRGKPFAELVHQKDRKKLVWLPPPDADLDLFRTIELDILTTDHKSKPFVLTYLYVNAHSLGFNERVTLPEINNVNALYGMATSFEDQISKTRILERQIKELEAETAVTRMVCRKLIDILEDNRFYVAKNICEKVAESLGAMKLEFNDWLQKLSAAVPAPQIDKIRNDLIQRTANLISVVKEKAHRLMPRVLETLGLESALRVLAEDVSRATGIHIDFFSNRVPVNLPIRKTLMLYRLVETALWGIARNRSATTAFISLIAEREKVVVIYEDDSKPSKASIGLYEEMQLEISLMREMVAYAGGKLFIDPNSSGGLFFSAEIPT